MIRAALVLLHLVIGTTAIGAGQALARKPSGEALKFDTDWLKDSPFPDYRVPGLFLAIVVGGSNLVSLVAQLRCTPSAPLASFASGLLLVAWIAIQTAIIGYRHWSQVLWMATFAVVTIFGGVQVLGARSSRCPIPIPRSPRDRRPSPRSTRARAAALGRQQ